jgi:hypothetical protein
VGSDPHFRVITKGEKMFHKHKWEDVSCTYTPGASKLNGDIEASEYLIEKLLLGVTNIVQRCTKCNKISSYQFVGEGKL